MSRKMNEGQLTDLTYSIIRSYYTGAAALILERLHNDITWINNLNNQCLYGYYCVSSDLFKTPRSPYRRICFKHSHLMSLSPDTIVVSCEYTILFQSSPPDSIGSHYYSSLIWKLDEEQPKLIYVHMSPTVTDREAPAGSLSIPGHHAEIYRINPEEIMYIEASNIQCGIYLRSGKLDANQSISRIETMLPPYFMRTHRSYIVNKQYIRRIFRYGMELSNGVLLPVPEKRYMKVVCWIET